MAFHNRPLPLKVAIIGLSASAVTSWAATGHLPYLLSENGRRCYEIVALCNSSEDAARRAIEHYQLPQTVKAYGSPDDLANDPDIDMIICNTRVDRHKETIMPSILTGKDIYIEWPVASNASDVNDILLAAEEHNVRVAVGLQGRWAPPVAKLREVLEKGEVGKVLGSEVHIRGGPAAGHDTLSTGWEYFAEKGVGGSSVTILFGHLIDQAQHVLGPVEPQSTSVHASILWPRIRVVDQQKSHTVKEINTDVPDLLYLTGALRESSLVTPSATFFASFHRAWPYPGEATISWTITCQNADLRIRVFDYPSLQADAYGKEVLIEIHQKDAGGTDRIDWQWPEWTKDMSVRGRNTAQSLQAFASGSEDGWADLKSAARLTEQLECWIDGRIW